MQLVQATKEVLEPKQATTAQVVTETETEDKATKEIEPEEVPVESLPDSSPEETATEIPSETEGVPVESLPDSSPEESATEAPSETEEVHQPEVTNVEETAAVSTKSKEEDPVIVEFAPQCSRAQEVRITKCLTPLSDRWQAIRNQQPELNNFKFALFRHETEDLIDLCEIVEATFEDCLDADLIKGCSENIFMEFVYRQLGSACGQKQKEFFVNYSCLLEVHRDNGDRCMSHIRGQYIPGMPQPLKCQGIPEYFNCMEEEISDVCGPSSLLVFLEAIQNFGCDIQNPDVRIKIIEEPKVEIVEGVEEEPKEETTAVDREFEEAIAEAAAAAGMFSENRHSNRINSVRICMYKMYRVSQN